MVKDTPALGEVFAVVDALDGPRPAVLCDMYENQPEQVYDGMVRYGGPLLRGRTLGRAIIARVRAVEARCLPRASTRSWSSRRPGRISSAGTASIRRASR
jgi:hypothetical protein